MTEQALSVAMCEIVALAERLGISKINQLPACWEHQVDAHWWIALNGHRIPTKCSKDVEVEPFGCYVEFNGWPAGTFNAYGGIMAAGSLGNEAAFVAALKEAGL
jgi:hypothetical protein